MEIFQLLTLLQALLYAAHTTSLLLHLFLRPLLDIVVTLGVEIVKAVTVFLETQTHLALSAIDTAQSWTHVASVLFLTNLS